MAESLNRLLAIGFKPVGKWSTVNNVLRLTLEPAVMHEQNVLYAFVVDGALTYVGKTTQSLLKRMQGYRSPASSAERGGSTNIKNNRNILNALSIGSTVDIYALHALPSQQHGEFSVNLCAGLEDSLINALLPPWNGRGTASSPLRGGNLSDLTPKPAAADPSESAAATLPLAAIMPASPGDSVAVPTADALLMFCNSVQGEPLTTMVRKTQFRVEVVDNILEITPVSSGGVRRENKTNIDALLARFDKTRSFQMSDYQDVSFNASYVLALVKAWQSQSRR
ncbi:GIY-YIG nuclease family protein [Massilia aquatica]|uniref:GIY-YIG nuclease family protein n=1 Tax=Massilia aquatica TaxID=2609000 RepID=A0ABX0MM21_9BURK|nr:GIY-YIG nuclease family protein [Massilia aquatica]NHZ44599.1 GIY-YIG nuclease family protein [Massilia aquatica]